MPTADGTGSILPYLIMSMVPSRCTPTLASISTGKPRIVLRTQFQRSIRTMRGRSHRAFENSGSPFSRTSRLDAEPSSRIWIASVIVLSASGEHGSAVSVSPLIGDEMVHSPASQPIFSAASFHPRTPSRFESRPNARMTLLVEEASKLIVTVRRQFLSKASHQSSLFISVCFFPSIIS